MGRGQRKGPGSFVLKETKGHGSKQMGHMDKGNDKDKINLWSYCGTLNKPALLSTEPACGRRGGGGGKDGGCQDRAWASLPQPPGSSSCV